MTQPKTYLVVGASGMLGSALVAALRQAGNRVIATSRHNLPDTISLDLSDNFSRWNLPTGIDVAFLCAGMTSVPGCRAMPDLARAVNVTGTVELARRLVAEGTFVVFPSSNRVFDGTVPFQRAEAPTCPMTEYGRTKATAEERLLSFGKAAAIVRLTKILGPRSQFIVQWKESLLQGTAIHPCNDMVMAPVPLDYVVESFIRVAEARADGISQASGEIDISFEDASRHMCKVLAVRDSLIEPIRCINGATCLDHVPAFTTLDARRISALTGCHPPNLETALQSILQPAL